MQGRFALQKAALAVRRPDLTWRWLRGLNVIEITVDEIAPHIGDRPVIVEAGACNGEDTARFAQRWPGATIHAFEPVPSAFAEVEARTGHLPQVRRYAEALSDRTGTATMHVSADADGGHRPDSSSLLPPAGHATSYSEVTFVGDIEVPTVTLNDWAAREHVERIDLMWLDMQGMEFPTLKASPEILQRTRSIVMEISRRDLYAGSGLYDEISPWMRSHGFRPVIDRVAVIFGNALFVNDDIPR
jgi:FkbM family methyltransferase